MNSEDNRIITAVRIRPLSKEEKAAGRRVVAQIGSSQGDIAVVNPSFLDSSDQSAAKRDLNERVFSYDHSFQKKENALSDQAEIYNQIGKPIVKTCLEGVNCSLFAYGQTGSGKTYTMMGRMNESDMGIIPRLCRDLLLVASTPLRNDDNGEGGEVDGGKAEKSKNICKYPPVINVGYYEIYNEKIYDLLGVAEDGSNICRIREHVNDGVYVEGLTLASVSRYSDVAEVLAQGMTKRQTAPTLMNAESSRSHAVFTIFIKQTLEIPLSPSPPSPEECNGTPSTTMSTPNGEQKYKKTTIERRSKVCLIDLAGSERVNLTGATGDRLKEATKINLSLSTLGDVIRTLSEQSRTDEKFVPYRNSSLTWILKDSLGGNSKTAILATISPIDASYSESMNTLRYVERAKLIVNKIVVNDDNSNDPYIKHLQSQVAAYKSKLAAALLKIKLRESEYQEHLRIRQKEFDDMQAELSRLRLRTDEDSCDSTPGDCGEEHRLFCEQIYTLNAECARLNTELLSKTDELNFALDDLDNSKAHALHLSIQLNQSKQEYDQKCANLMQDIKELELELTKLKKEDSVTAALMTDDDLPHKCERLELALAAKMEDYDVLTHSLEEFEAREEEMGCEIEDLKYMLSAKNEEMEKVIDKYGAMLGEKESELISMSERLDELKTLVMEKDSVEFSLNEKIAALECEKEELVERDEMQLLQNNLIKKAEENKMLTARLEKLKEEGDGISKIPNSNECRVESTAQIGELAVLKILNKNKDHNINESQRSLEDLTQELFKMQVNLKHSAQQSRDLEKLLVEKDSEIEFVSRRKQSTIDSQLREIKELKCDCDDFRKEIAMLTNDIKIARDHKNQYSDSLEERELLLSDVACLEEKVVSKEFEISKLRTVLQLSQQQANIASDAMKEYYEKELLAVADEGKKVELSLQQSIKSLEEKIAVEKNEVERLQECLEASTQRLREVQVTQDAVSATYEQKLLGLSQEKDSLYKIELSLRNDISRMEQDLSEREHQVSSLQEALQHSKHKYNETKISNEQLKNEYENKLQHLKAANDKLSFEESSLRSEMSILQDDLESSQRIVVETKNANHTMQVEYEVKITALAEDVKKLGGVEMTLRNEVVTLEKRVAEKESEICGLQGAVQVSERSAEEAKEAIQTLQKDYEQQLSMLSTERDRLGKVISEMEHEYLKLEEAMRVSQQRSEEAKVLNDNMKGDYENQLSALNEEKNRLCEAEASMRGELSRLQDELQESRLLADDDRVNFEKEMSALAEDVKKLGGVEMTLRNEVVTLEKRVAEKESEICGLQGAVQVSERSAEEAKEAIQTLQKDYEQQLSMLSTERDRLGKVVSEMEHEYLKLEEAMRVSQQRSEEAKVLNDNMKGDYENQLSALNEEKNRLCEAEASMRGELSRLQDELQESRLLADEDRVNFEKEMSALAEDVKKLGGVEMTLRNEVVTLEKRVAEKESEICGLQGAVQVSERSAEEAKVAIQTLQKDYEQQLSMLSTERDRLGKVVSEMEHEYLKLEEAMRVSQQRSEEAKVLNDNMKGDYENQLSALNEEKNRLCEAEASMRGELSRLQDELQESRLLADDDRVNFEKEMSALAEDVKKLGGVEMTLRNEVVTLEKRVAEKESEICGLQGAVQVSERSAEEAKEAIQTLQKDYEQQLSMLSTERDRLGKVVSEMEHEYLKLEEAMRVSQQRSEEAKVLNDNMKGDYENQLSALNEEKNRLCEAEASMRGELSRLQDELQESRLLADEDRVNFEKEMSALAEDVKKLGGVEMTLRNEVVTLEKRVAEKESEICGLQGAVQVSERSAEEAKEAIQTLQKDYEQQLSMLSTERDRLGKVVSEMEHEYLKLEEAMRVSQQRSEEAKVLNDNMKGDYENQLSALNEEKNRLCEAEASMRGELSRLQDELQESRLLADEDRVNFEKEMSALAEDVKKLGGVEMTLRNEVVTLEKRVAEKESEICGLQGAVQVSERSAEEAKEAIQTLQKDYEQQLSMLSTERDRLGKVVSEMEHEYLKLEEAMRVSQQRSEEAKVLNDNMKGDYENQLSALNEEKNRLCEAEASMRGELSRLQDELQESRLLADEDRVNFEKEMSALAEDVKKLGGVEMTLRNEVVTLEKRVAEKESEICGLQGAVQVSERSAEEAKEAIQTLQKDYEQQLSMLSTERDEVSIREGALRVELSELRKFADEVKDANSILKVNYERELSSLASSADKFRKDSISLQGDVARFEQAFQVKEEELVMLQGEKEKYLLKEVEWKKEKYDLICEEAKLKKRVKDMIEGMSGKDKKLAELENSLLNLEQLLNQNKSAKERMRVEYENKMSRLSKEKDSLKDSEASLQIRVASLGQTIHDMEELKDDLNMQLEERERYACDQINSLEKDLSAKELDVETITNQLNEIKEAMTKQENMFNQQMSELESKAEATEIGIRASLEAAKVEIARLLEKEADLVEQHSVVEKDLKDKLNFLQKDFEEKEDFFVQYKTKAFSTIEGLQNEIDILKRQLYLGQCQHMTTAAATQDDSGDIDLVKTTVHNLKPRYVDVDVSAQNSSQSHDHDSMANELISAKLRLAQMHNEVSTLALHNKRLEQELQEAKSGAKMKWKVFK